METNKLELAKLALINFMNEMNIWEVKTFELYQQENGGPEGSGEAAKKELQKIYDTYLTKKERKTGRMSGPNAGYPPEFDILAEKIFSSEMVTQNKVIILTKWIHPTKSTFSEDYRYTLILKNKVWLLDKKEVFSSLKNKWVNRVL